MRQFLLQCGPLTDECNMHACIDPVHGALMSLDAWRTTALLAVLAADSKQRHGIEQ